MKTLCVLFGGVSSEHEVSLASAAMVLETINRAHFSPVMLGITREGRWLYYDGPVELVRTGEWEASRHTLPAVFSPDRDHGGLLVLKEQGAVPIRVDAAFGVLHGKNGEDGTIQGLFELAGVPYVGAGVLSSALCMDKAVAHVLLTRAGLPKTKLEVVRRGEEEALPALEQRLASSLGYPMYIKPANAGSSVGVSKVKGPGELAGALALAFLHDKKLVAEQEVLGQEVECSVMGNESPVAAGVLGEIAPTTEFYDYDAKYKDDTARLYIPAHIGEDIAARVREMAVKAYAALECEGFARVDFFVRESGEVLLNEVNTIPGFTAISMFPKLFEADGLSNSQLIDRLVEYALERQGRGNS